MFFNDPILYGTTFPYKDLYKDLPMQAPFMGFAPWQKMIPQFQHFLPQYNVPQHFLPQYNVPQQFLPQYNVPQQFLPQYNLLPYNLQHFNKFIPPYNVPFQFPWNVQIPQHFEMKLPQYGWQFPFVY